MLTTKLEQFRQASLEKDRLLAEFEASEPYAQLCQDLKGLEVEIQQEVKTLAKTQKIDGVIASYRKGVARVDYEAAAKALGIPTAGYESVKIDYTKAVKAAKLEPAKLHPYTKTGDPTVSISLEV